MDLSLCLLSELYFQKLCRSTRASVCRYAEGAADQAVKTRDDAEATVARLAARADAAMAKRDAAAFLCENTEREAMLLHDETVALAAKVVAAEAAAEEAAAGGWWTTQTVFCVVFCSLLFPSVPFCSRLFSSVLFYSLLFPSVLFYSFAFYFLFSGMHPMNTSFRTSCIQFRARQSPFVLVLVPRTSDVYLYSDACVFFFSLSIAHFPPPPSLLFRDAFMPPHPMPRHTTPCPIASQHVTHQITSRHAA